MTVSPRAFAKAAEDTLKSFRVAQDGDFRGVRKMVVRLVTAGGLDTADSLSRRMGGLEKGPDLFYILNNLFPGETLKAGEKYKIVSME